VILHGKEQVLFELSTTLDSIDKQAVGELEHLIIGAREVYFHGLGRSGLCCRAFAMRLMQMGFQCNIVGDILAHPIQTGDLLIIVSASGEGKGLQIIAQKAKGFGANFALVTSNADSPLSKLADTMVAIEAPTKDDIGCERASIMPMGSLFEETTGLLFDLIIVDLMECMKITNNDMVSHHANLE
jgi:6-phospho-3-hexuloisomerase